MFSRIESMKGMLNDARAHAGGLMTSNLPGADVSRAALVFDLLCQAQMQLIRLRADFILQQNARGPNEACFGEDDGRTLKMMAAM